MVANVTSSLDALSHKKLGCDEIGKRAKIE